MSHITPDSAADQPPRIDTCWCGGEWRDGFRYDYGCQNNSHHRRPTEAEAKQHRERRHVA